MKSFNGYNIFVKIELKIISFYSTKMSLTRVFYDDLVLGKEYKIKKDDVLYKGIYYMHYKKYHDGKEPLIFIEVTPNPENKKYFEFKMSDEYYE
jgi:hypothetical protein